MFGVSRNGTGLLASRSPINKQMIVKHSFKIAKFCFNIHILSTLFFQLDNFIFHCEGGFLFLHDVNVIFLAKSLVKLIY